MSENTLSQKGYRTLDEYIHLGVGCLQGMGGVCTPLLRCHLVGVLEGHLSVPTSILLYTVYVEHQFQQPFSATIYPPTSPHG